MSAVRKALAIARVNLVRTMRDRTGFFFIFVLPFIIIAALGIQFGSATQARIGVVAPAGDPFADEFIARLESDDVDFEVRRSTDQDAIHSGVERGSLEAGVVIPEDYTATLRAGGSAPVRFVGTPENTTTGLRQSIEAALGAQSILVVGARAGQRYGDVDFETALGLAREGVTSVPGLSVAVVEIGEAPWYAGFGQFTLAAQTQLVLFVFMTSMTAAAQLVMSKQLGVSRRMLATATAPGTVIAGESLGRFGVALLQAVVIVGITAIVFGVDWGDPLGAVALILAFSLVSAAFAMLIGAMSRNAEQAGSVGVFASLALAALGGCMIPIQFMPEVMQQLARLTPHLWAIEGFAGLVPAGTTLVDVLPEVGVLLAYGTIAFAIAIWRFRRAITG